MTRRATKDTFATEAVGPDLEVRRKVFAGQLVPDQYDVPAGAVEDIGDVGPTGYPHEYTSGHGGTTHDYDRGERRTATGRRKPGTKSEQKS